MDVPALRAAALRLFLRQFRLPRDIVRFAFRRYQSRTALLTPRGALTYAQLENRVLRLTAGLLAMGVGKGDHVFCQIPDDWEQIEIRLAAQEIGVILTSFPTVVSDEWIYEVTKLAQPRAFIFDPRIGANAAARLAASIPNISLLATGPGERYESLLAASQPRLSPTRLSSGDIAALGFTSGTTGRPKGLVATQGVFITSLRMTVANVRVTPGQADVFLLGIPLSGAGSGVVLPMLLSGATLVIPPAYEAGELLRLIPELKVTRTFMTPSMLLDVLDWPGIEQFDLSTLRNVIYGTAPMPAVKLEEAINRFGPIFQQGYGMAEVLPPVSMLQMEEHVRDGRPAPRHVLNSAGHVAPGVRIQIRDERDEPMPPGHVGQIAIASPTMFNGYWKRPDLTAQTLRGGWMRTGDYGYFDDEGLLHVLNRRADLIWRRQGVIYPRLIEETIHDHPAIKDACLVSSSADGPTVMCVSLRHAWRHNDPLVIARDLQRFLTDRVEHWQIPDQVQIFEELPRSFLGKVLRREVRAALARQFEAVSL